MYLSFQAAQLAGDLANALDLARSPLKLLRDLMIAIELKQQQYVLPSSSRLLSCVFHAVIVDEREADLTPHFTSEGSRKRRPRRSRMRTFSRISIAICPSSQRRCLFVEGRPSSNRIVRSGRHTPRSVVLASPLLAFASDAGRFLSTRPKSCFSRTRLFSSSRPSKLSVLCPSLVLDAQS